MTSAVGPTLDVLDWRRRVWSLYDRVRAADDPADGHRMWRQGRDELFAEHPASPLPPEARRVFAGLPVAPYDPHWRFELTIEPAEPVAIEMSTGTGTDGDVPYERVGRIRLSAGQTLDVWRLQSYGGGLFLPVRDALAGAEGGTYGGGRYVLDTIKGADLGPGRPSGSVVVDLNFAYNPSCAYDPAWACPLAPPGNVVGIEISAGELYPTAPDGRAAQADITS